MARKDDSTTDAALDEHARKRRPSVAAVLGEKTSTDEEQRRLHDAASRFIGALPGCDPDRAERVRERVRERLMRQRIPERGRR